MKGPGLFLLFFLILLRVSAEDLRRDSIPSDSLSRRFVSLKGSIVGGEEQEVLPGAYIYLGEKKVAVTVTNNKGEFLIPRLPVGEIWVSVSYTGYQTYSGKYLVKTDQDIGVICLQPEVLEEVVVKATPPLVVQRGDTTQFNPAALKTAADASLEDLLKKLPGFELVDGKIMAQGKEVTKLCVDGMEYSFTDPAANLKNLPANLFARIKMFDEQSEEAKFSGFDDGNRYRTLNLETHRPEKKKIFGNANGGYGLTDPLKNTFKENNYRAELSANLFDPKQKLSVSGEIRNNGIDNDLPGKRYTGEGGDNNSYMLFVNLSSKWNKKLSVSTNYRYSGGNSYSASLSEQSYFPAENYESRIYNRENHNWDDNQGHGINLRMRYDWNEKNSILLSPTLSVDKNHSKSVSWGDNTENSDTINVTDVTNFNKGNAIRVGGELLWMHSFRKKGRTLTVKLNGQYTRRNSDEAQNNEERSLKTEGGYMDTLRNLTGISQNTTYSFTPSLTYSEPLTEHSRFAFNYSYQENSERSDKESLSFRDKAFTVLIGIDSAQTNQLKNVYRVHRYGWGYQYHKKKLSLGGGLQLSHTEMENRYLYPGGSDSLTRSVYNDVTPSLNLRMNIKEQQSVSLSYHGSSTSPNATQLQDVLEVSNPLQVSKGNPGLKKSYSHNLSVDFNESYSKSSVYWYSSLEIGQTFNQISSNVKVIQRDTVVNGYTLLRGAQLTSPVNLDGNWNFGLSSSCSFPWKRLKLRFNTSLGYHFNHSPSIYDDQKNYTSAHTASLNMNINTNFSEKWEIYLSANSSYSASRNTTTGGSRLFNENVNGSVRWIFWKGFFVYSSYGGQFYVNKKEETVRQNQHILNVGAGKKFGKKQRMELSLTGNDVLQEKNTMNYTLNDLYAETSYRTMPSTYYMLKLTYRFNNIDRLLKSSE